MAYITPLVINTLGGGHKHLPMHEQKRFQEIRHGRPQAVRTCFNNYAFENVDNNISKTRLSYSHSINHVIFILITL